MRLVFLGAPGVGKGTQADRISAESKWPKISTGDLLREAVRNKTELGLEAKRYMDQGQLVPDAVVIGLVRDRVGQPACARGFILDGFPRTVRQAEELTSMLTASGTRLDRVVNFQVPREQIVRRLSGRRSCPGCQAVFHVEFSPPVKSGLCDRCGQSLVQRTDDKPETIAARLKVYEEQTSPLIDYYRGQKLLVDLDASGAVDLVHQQLVKLLNKHGTT